MTRPMMQTFTNTYGISGWSRCTLKYCLGGSCRNTSVTIKVGSEKGHLWDVWVIGTQVWRTQEDLGGSALMEWLGHYQEKGTK